jgi:dipeptidyl aminopeptidase/acylaminoacyl peptidase
MLVGAGLVGVPVGEAAYPGRSWRVTFNAEVRVAAGARVLRTEAVRPDGGGRRILGDFAFASWSASGRRSVGLAYPPGAPGRLVLGDRDGELIDQIALPQAVSCDWPTCPTDGPSEPFSPGPYPPALSPNGRTVAFVTQFFVPNTHPQEVARWIWTVRTDGSGLRLLGPGDEPHWTPDGRRIVFQRFDDFGSIHEIAWMRPNGTRVRRLRTRSDDDRLLDVAPDGRRLLWWGQREPAGGGRGPHGLFTGDLRGRHVRSIERTAYAYDGAWSPDGSMIAFSRQGPGGATWVASPTGERKRRVLGRPHDGLAWQPRP